MKRTFYERLRKIEKATYEGNTLWCVRVEAGDRWTPYEVDVATGKERHRTQTMTGADFIEWQDKLGKRALVVLDEE